MGPYSLPSIGNPVPDKPIPDSPLPDTALSDSPAKVQDNPIPVPDNPVPGERLPDTGVSDNPIPGNPLPSTGVTDTGMTEDEQQQILAILRRIAQIADPGQRAQAATEAVNAFDQAEGLARKIRRGTIAYLLESGMGPAAVARATGMSESTVKVVKQSMEGE